MSSLLLLMMKVLCGSALHLVARCCRVCSKYGEKSDDNRSFRNGMVQFVGMLLKQISSRGFKRLIFVGANYVGVAISASRQ